jgi:hypothetical protein
MRYNIDATDGYKRFNDQYEAIVARLLLNPFDNCKIVSRRNGI